MPIHDEGELRVTLVFDGRGREIVVERPSLQSTFSVVYTPSTLTADDVIEHMVANSTAPAECCVATDDNGERETVSALGAATIHSADLAEWVKRVQSRRASTLEKRRDANTRSWKKS
jgi:predicted RNA-binding protein with PIN domain